MTVLDTRAWTDVCGLADLPPEAAVCALVRGVPVAVVRTYDGDLYAVGNIDPASGASVMSRGIVGTRADLPTLSSPMYKQVYDLGTGECLDDPSMRLPVYAVRRAGDRVEVATA